MNNNEYKYYYDNNNYINKHIIEWILMHNICMYDQP
jgi:hypothetical protein